MTNKARQVGVVEDFSVAELTLMRDVYGQELCVDAVYCEHPLKGGVLIPSEELHTHMLKKQRAQIIRYFRSAVALKEAGNLDRLEEVGVVLLRRVVADDIGQGGSYP